MTRTAGMFSKLALPEMKSVLLSTSGSEKEFHLIIFWWILSSSVGTRISGIAEPSAVIVYLFPCPLHICFNGSTNIKCVTYYPKLLYSYYTNNTHPFFYFPFLILITSIKKHHMLRNKCYAYINGKTITQRANKGWDSYRVNLKGHSFFTQFLFTQILIFPFLNFCFFFHFLFSGWVDEWSNTVFFFFCFPSLFTQQSQLKRFNCDCCVVEKHIKNKCITWKINFFPPLLWCFWWYYL